jgi:hypothetical protein
LANYQHGDTVYRLSGKRVLLADFETENVAGDAGKVEVTDLAPAVADDLLGMHRAVDDLVNLLSRLTFAEGMALGPNFIWADAVSDRTTVLVWDRLTGTMRSSV